MPPRLSKRQQREKEELNLLAGDEEASSEEESLAVKPVVSGFAALAHQLDGQNEQNVDEEDDEDANENDSAAAGNGQKKAKKKNKKKKKKAQDNAITSEGTETVPKADSPRPTASSKKSNKKAKVKAGEYDEDEIEKTLAKLALKNPAYKQVAMASQQRKESSFFDKQNALLSVSLSHLDADSEMRKFFGSKVVGSSSSQSKQRKGGRAAGQNLKSNLTKPADSWGTTVYREGLSIRQLTPEEFEIKEQIDKPEFAKTDRWWTVQYSKRYCSVTRAFVKAVGSGDPEGLYRILSELPWHADTLLQMSEVCRHREEHATTVDYLSRALFSYERSLMGAFTFTSGANRLDYNRVENRPFFLAVSRMLTDLQRRGCSRTASEFARLLLSLDPYTDPLGALLYLDYLSIRSGMQDWLLSFWDLHETEAQTEKTTLWNHFNVTALPGWLYGRALALRMNEENGKKSHDESDKALAEAIASFPSIVPLLADKIDAVISGDIRGHPSFRVHVDASSLDGFESLLHLLSHLYAQRSASLWKIPERATWFKNTVESVFRNFDANKGRTFRARFDKQFTSDIKSNRPLTTLDLLQSRLALSIYRHAHTLPDSNLARRLTAFFPRELTHSPSFSYDPLPPFDAISYYDDTFFEGTQDIFAYRPRTRREREMDQRNLARMIPDANVRHQLQAIFDAQPQLQAQFPQGVLQFAQAAAGMGEDLFDILLPQMMMNGEVEGNPGNRMPGQLNGFDELEGDVAGDDDVHDHGNLDDGGNVGDRDDVDELSDVEDEDESESEDEDQEPPPTLPMRVWQNIVHRFWGNGDG